MLRAEISADFVAQDAVPGLLDEWLIYSGGSDCEPLDRRGARVTSSGPSCRAAYFPLTQHSKLKKLSDTNPYVADTTIYRPGGAVARSPVFVRSRASLSKSWKWNIEGEERLHE